MNLLTRLPLSFIGRLRFDTSLHICNKQQQTVTRAVTQLRNTTITVTVDDTIQCNTL